jgi:hypothetical protein
MTRGVLSALAAGMGWSLGRALSAPLRRPVCASGPLPPECCDPGESASAVPMSGAPSGPAVSGSRDSAMAWAEAISQAGACLCDEGFEDEALGCFRIAGDLIERVETWGQRA